MEPITYDDGLNIFSTILTAFNFLAPSADDAWPLVQKPVPTNLNMVNFVDFLNSQSTWQWRIMSLSFGIFFFFFAVCFAAGWDLFV